MSGARGVRLLIVGPPGAGKGTQGARIRDAYGIPDVSTGDLFRENIRNRTPLGVEVKKIVDAGDYVPDALTNELITARLKEDDARGGFLLDGYPRTLEQVGYLDTLLASTGQSLDAVIQLVADEDELVARLTRRAQEQGRSDDTEEAIRHRQEVYARETSPLVEIYRERGLLVAVDGLGPVDEVSARIAEALVERGVQPIGSAEESVA